MNLKRLSKPKLISDLGKSTGSRTLEKRVNLKTFDENLNRRYNPKATRTLFKGMRAFLEITGLIIFPENLTNKFRELALTLLDPN